MSPLPVPEDVAERIWFGPDMTWTGANGDTFSLRFGSGVCLLPDDIVGLLSAPHELRTSATPARGGSRLRDVTVGEREVFWPLMVYSVAGSRAWQELNDRFNATLDPERPGVWQVTRADGSTRRLNVYFKGDGGSIGYRTLMSGWVPTPVSGVALDPWWYGVEQYRRFKQSDADGGLAGPGRPIGSRATVDSAEIDNPGDVPSFPRWVISGPTTSVTVGVTIDGVVRSITVPFTLTEGQQVVIDTDSHSVRDQSGASRRAELSSAFFVPIPPGRGIPLTMSMTGTGLVECFLPTRYRRAI
jgi:hypothetical protein